MVPTNIELGVDVDFEAAYLGEHTEQAVEYAVRGGDVVAFTSRSPVKDGVAGEVNQDAVAVFAHGAGRTVLAIADGLGGHPGGDEASMLALVTLEHELRAAPDDPAAVRSAILAGFEHANEAILALGTGSGTTLIVAEIDRRTLRTYHVGDSGALLFGGRGRLKLETVAHSPVGYALQAGLIDEAEAMVHEERHLVSNVVGDAQMRVEVGSAIALQPRDTLIVASDGLFDNLRIAEIIELARRGPLGDAAGALVGECRRRMTRSDAELSKPDDLALAVFRPSAREPSS